jgi:D-sedoheptulose 7-phosphate isomerase
MSFVDQYLEETARVVALLPRPAIERIVQILAEAKQGGGRVFVLGVGGSAANASHLVNDLRKLAGLETYAPTDNVSELTARANDEGWPTIFAAWLKGSRLNHKDVVYVLSVGGGDLERNISPNLVKAVEYAKQVGARVVGVVGRAEGYTARMADACVVVPEVNPAHVTPHTESFHSVVGHILVSHPALKSAPTKWESAVGANPGKGPA